MKAYLSYPSEHLKVARELYDFLKAVDVEVWFDKESLIGGQDWNRERAEAQKRADLTVLICSAETVGRPGVIQREIQDILDLLKDQPLGHIYLVSVRIDDIQLPPELERYHYVDYFQPDWQLKLGRSIELKSKQSGTPIPIKLATFLETSPLPNILKLNSLNEKTELLEIGADFFTYNLDGDYWTYVNSLIVSNIFGRFYRAKFDSIEIRLDMLNEWSITVKEFFRLDDVISLRLLTYGFLSGAAHGNYWYSTINLAGPTVGKFELIDMFDFDLVNFFESKTKVCSFLKNYCDLDLKRQLLQFDTDAVPSFPKTEAETWKILSKVNFDRRGLTFIFSPYDVLPYVFGAYEVLVPWEMVRDKISPKIENSPLAEIIS
jgi:hypothetical protein